MFIIRRRNETFGTNLVLRLVQQSLNSAFGCEKITQKTNINVKKLYQFKHGVRSRIIRLTPQKSF